MVGPVAQKTVAQIYGGGPTALDVPNLSVSQTKRHVLAGMEDTATSEMSVKSTENTHELRDKLLGGFWGLLIGSAFGEVRASWLKNPPPKGNIRERLPGASWGFEGAQVLCMLMMLQEESVSLESIAAHSVAGARLGIYFPDSEFRFADLHGPLSSPTLWGQNLSALKQYQQHSNEQCALLFSLPLLWNGYDSSQTLAHRGLILGRDALKDDVDRATLVMGTLLAVAYMEGRNDAWKIAAENLLLLSAHFSISSADVETVIATEPGDASHARTHRMLYLLAHVHQALEITKTFDQAVDFAMAPKQDLRIPMALVGMMAGLHYGASCIPSGCLTNLRGRVLADQCVASFRHLS